MMLSISSPPLPLLYKQTAVEDSLWQGREYLCRPATDETVVEAWGMEGRPMPVTPQRTDSLITGLFVCVLVMLLLRRLHRPSLQETITNFFFPARTMSSDSKEAKEGLYLAIASLFCIETAIVGYIFVQDHIILVNSASSWILLGGMALTFLICLVTKNILYRLVHSVFFTKEQRHRWRENYVFLFTAGSLLFFPLLILHTEQLISLQVMLFGGIFVVLLVKFWLLLRCFSTFFSKSYGLLHLFVYFCALEIAFPLIFGAILLGIYNHLTII